MMISLSDEEVLSTWRNMQQQLNELGEERLAILFDKESLDKLNKIRKREEEVNAKFPANIIEHYKTVERDAGQCLGYSRANGIFSRSRIAEIFPGEFKTSEQLIKYLEKRSYSIVRTDYDPNFIYGIPKYDFYIPRAIVLWYKGDESKEITVISSCKKLKDGRYSYHNNVTVAGKEGPVDIGAAYPDRHVPLKQMEPRTLAFTHYPEDLSFRNYSDYGYTFPVNVGLCLLGYYEEPQAETAEYQKKVVAMAERVGKFVDILSLQGYGICYSSYTPRYGRVERANDIAYINNTTDITLVSKHTDASVTFTLNKMTMSTAIYCHNHSHIACALGFNGSIWADDMTDDEILELISVCWERALDPKCISSPWHSKSSIVFWYNQIINQEQGKTTDNAYAWGDRLFGHVLRDAVALRDDPEVGETAKKLIHEIGKMIVTFKLERDSATAV